MNRNPETVPILEGEALLVRIPKSPKWQVRYKAGGKWIRTSTKQKELDKAKKVAVEIILDARYREKYELPIVNQTFRAVANSAIKRMEKELANGQGRKIYRDYIWILNRYFLPYFGPTYVKNIDYKALAEFDAWRTEEAKKPLAKSSISNHNAALNRVFAEAVLLKYLSPSDVPVLQNNGVPGERRPHFDRKEYGKLHRFMRTWVKQKTRKEKSKQIRLLLRDLVLILTNTGMRMGTEITNLRWKHLTLYKDKGREYLEIYVPKSKTEPRTIVARRRCKSFFTRIYQRQDDLKQYKTFEELLEARVDLPVFRLNDGSVPKRLDEAFKRLLTDAGLLICPRTGEKRVLYSCRHTYATFEVNKGTEIHTLARQMGTSSALIDKYYSHHTPHDARDRLAGY